MLGLFPSRADLYTEEPMTQQIATPPAKVAGSGQVIKPDGTVRTDAPAPAPKPDEVKK